MNKFLFSLVTLLSMPLLRLAAMGGAPDPNAPPPTAAQSLMGFLPLIAIVGIFYFLILRPQNKKQKETQKMLSALKKGDRVITIGGIHGTIQTVREHSVVLRVDDNTKIEFSRNAVSGIEAQGKEEKNEELPDSSAEEK